MAQKNYLKIPRRILDRIETYDQDDVVVACVKQIKPDELVKYEHLGILNQKDGVIIPEPRCPDASAGRYSRANLFGYEKVRKDLPMIQKEFSVESPNWGDASNGTHTVTWTRDVYHRDFYPPKEVTLSIELLERKDAAFVLKFSVDQVISRRTSDFEKELLYNLNILQENVGAANVFPSAATLADYKKSIHVDWKILPPGSVDEVVERILRGKRRVTADQEATIKERISTMSKLDPESYITGTDSFLRYFGAKFGDDLIVFENVHYGNAIYVMYENWEELSRKSRVELLAGPTTDFERIVHQTGWEDRLKKLVAEYRELKE